jgi:hypothetical protein
MSKDTKASPNRGAASKTGMGSSRRRQHTGHDTADKEQHEDGSAYVTHGRTVYPWLNRATERRPTG